MSTDDKARNMGENLKGKTKEGAGRATGDRSMQAKGKAEQTKANLKQAGQKVKDAFR